MFASIHMLFKDGTTKGCTTPADDTWTPETRVLSNDALLYVQLFNTELDAILFNTLLEETPSGITYRLNEALS